LCRAHAYAMPDRSTSRSRCCAVSSGPSPWCTLRTLMWLASVRP
jgi:hypothetical protein